MQHLHLVRVCMQSWDKHLFVVTDAGAFLTLCTEICHKGNGSGVAPELTWESNVRRPGSVLLRCFEGQVHSSKIADHTHLKMLG